MYPETRERHVDEASSSSRGGVTVGPLGEHLNFAEERPASLLDLSDTPMDGGGMPERGHFTNWLDAMGDADFINFTFESQPAFDDLFFLQLPSEGGACSLPDGTSQQTEYCLSTHQDTTTPESTFSGNSANPAGTRAAQLSGENAENESGRYYADGEPGRLSRAKRQKIRHSHQAIESPSANIAAWSLAHPFPVDQDLLCPVEIEQSTYEHAKNHFQRLCSVHTALWPAFEPNTFPSKPCLEHLTGLYFKHFDPTFPFLKPANMLECRQDGVLLIAVSAIGSHYLEGHDATLIIAGLRELTRRTLVFLDEKHGEDRLVWHDCAHLLHLINAVYSGNENLRSRALDSKMQLGRIVSRARTQFETLDVVLQSTTGHEGNTRPSDEARWSDWNNREQAVRLLNCAWLLDAMWKYQFNEPPVLGLQIDNHPLPCHEDFWQATSAESWAGVDPSYICASSLSDALQQIYVEKKLDPHVGEFARVLIVHGIFQRSSQVGQYFGDPLSHWQPSAARHRVSEILPQQPIWLPSIQTFTKWQNAACDAIDVLHWQANATIGKASGLEHPTVLHLHFARIVLLTPYHEIIALARFLISPQKTQAEKKKADGNRLLVQRWAVQHQYKARLAAIHAGVTLWHAKRFSVDGFHEAPAVAIAGLVLWAFGTFAQQDRSRQPSGGPEDAPGTSIHSRREGEDPEHSDEGFCEIIYLDRPTDDELVQQFIRHGQRMKAYMTGVGDLYATNGPRRTLVQALRIIRALRCWSIGQQWHEFLSTLIGILKVQK